MALNEKQKKHLIEIVETFNSDDDAERALAAKQVAQAAKAQEIPIADLMFICFCSDKFIKHHMFAKPASKTAPKPAEVWEDDLDLDILDHQSLLEELESLLDIVGVGPLNDWEVNFSSDICSRQLTYLSEKQEACVVKIIAKLRRCEGNSF